MGEEIATDFSSLVCSFFFLHQVWHPWNIGMGLNTLEKIVVLSHCTSNEKHWTSCMISNAFCQNYCKHGCVGHLHRLISLTDSRELTWNHYEWIFMAMSGPWLLHHDERLRYEQLKYAMIYKDRYRLVDDDSRHKSVKAGEASWSKDGTSMTGIDWLSQDQSLYLISILLLW